MALTIQSGIDTRLFEGIAQVYQGGRQVSVLDAAGGTLIHGEIQVPPAISRQPGILPAGAAIGDSVTLDLGAASGTPDPAAIWDLTLDGISIRDQVDAFMALELAAPGRYELQVQWSNGIEAPVTATSAVLLIEAAIPPAAIDYAAVALAYVDADTPHEGTTGDVTAINAFGSGGWRFAKAGAGNAVQRSAAGFVFADGAYLQTSPLSGVPATDGLFAVADVTLTSYGANVGQIIDGLGSHIKLRNNAGTLQILASDDSVVSTSIGAATYGSRVIIGGEMDDVLNVMRGYNVSGALVSQAHPGLTDPAPTRVITGRYINGTLHRLAIVGRPEGQPWPVTMEEVFADFQRGA